MTQSIRDRVVGALRYARSGANFIPDLCRELPDLTREQITRVVRELSRKVQSRNIPNHRNPPMFTRVQTTKNGYKTRGRFDNSHKV